MAKLITTLSLLCLSLFSNAQQTSDSLKQITDSSYVPIAEKETVLMKDSLTLSDQAVQLIRTINQAYFAEIVQMIHQDLTPEQKKEQKDQLERNRDSALKEALTREQYYRYQSIVQNREQRLRNRHKNQ